MRPTTRIHLGSLAIFACAGCHRAPPPDFVVLRVSPALDATAPLLLNDTITVYFSAPIAPLSVLPDSVAVMDAEGHQVPGSLRAGATWITFTPQPPLTASLADGSFVPGQSYELRIAGFPRPDALRAADGRRLAAGLVLPFRAADRDHREAGLPAPLRPLANEVPLLLRHTDTTQELPADAPVLRLHFTQPLLPASATAAAFEIQSLRDMVRLVPTRVRIVTSSLDSHPGCTVEVDLGGLPLRGDGRAVPLSPDDWISVSLRGGEGALRDYRGDPVLPARPQFWHVVAGSTVCLLEWPSREVALPDEDPLAPGFEVAAGVVRPRVRIEAGDGSLGVFRPTKDTVVVAGVPFDRGDGVPVVSRGSHLPFAAIDVPAGVVVTLDARNGPLHLLAVGGIHIGGELRLEGGAAPLGDRRFVPVPAAALFDHGVTMLLAAGDVRLPGRVTRGAAVPNEGTPLVVASAGRIELGGELPFQTLLAVESEAARTQRAVVGPRGQTVVRPVEFTFGVPAGTRWPVRGATPWRRLPEGRTEGVLQLHDRDPALRVYMQIASPSAVHPEEVDPSPERRGRLQPVLDADRLVVPEGAFVRFVLEADVDSDRPPGLRELRIVTS